MTKIFDHNGLVVERSTTVGHLIASRRSNAHSAQVTAESAQEAAAAEAAGRPPPRIAGVVAVAIVPAEKSAAVRDAAQAEFAFYEGNMPYQRVIEASDADRIGDVCVIGDEEEVARRLSRFREAGMTDFLAAPYAVEGASWESTATKLSQFDF